MYTLRELKQALEKYPRIGDWAFDIGDYMAIVTKKKVYVADHCHYKDGVADGILDSERFRRRHKKVEDNVFESRKAGGDVAIDTGGRVHVLEAGWSRYNRKRFMKKLFSKHKGFAEREYY